MRSALRPLVTAGIALAGVGAVALTPIAAKPPDVKIAGPGVQLSSSPLDKYREALDRAIENAERLLEELFAGPSLAPTFRLEARLAGSPDNPDASAS